LPYTIAKAEKDYGPDSGILYYPNGVVPQQDFKEGLYFDYRYFDKNDVEPRYEFGYGLSYTNFSLSSMFVDSQHLTGGSEPAPRPKAIEPPNLDTKIPDPKEALWPEGLRKLKKFVYPYISSVSDIKTGQYQYPKGYDTPRALSPAGGAEGGNPDLYTSALKLQVTLANSGKVAGDSVIQLYVSLPKDVKSSSGKAVDMPVRVLRQFEKVHVDVDERAVVNMDVTRRDLSYWDVERQNWVLPKGTFEVCLGFSSRNLVACDKFDL
jgi:beta-glucosidase